MEGQEQAVATPSFPTRPLSLYMTPCIWELPKWRLRGSPLCPNPSSYPTETEKAEGKERGIWGDLVKCWLLGSIPRCSVALLYVFVVSFQHRLIIEKLDVLRAIFGIAEARKFQNCNCSLLKHWICSLIKIFHINSSSFQHAEHFSCLCLMFIHSASVEDEYNFLFWDHPHFNCGMFFFSFSLCHQKGFGVSISNWYKFSIVHGIKEFIYIKEVLYVCVLYKFIYICIYIYVYTYICTYVCTVHINYKEYEDHTWRMKKQSFLSFFFVQEGICICYKSPLCVQLQCLLQQKNDMVLR